MIIPVKNSRKDQQARQAIKKSSAVSLNLYFTIFLWIQSDKFVSFINSQSIPRKGRYSDGIILVNSDLKGKKWVS